MSAFRAAPGAVRVTGLLQAAARLLRASLLKCLPLAMLAMLCARLPNLYWIASRHAPGLRAQRDLGFDLLTLAGTAIELWLIGAMMLRQRAVALGGATPLRAELAVALRRLPVILLSTLLANLSVVAGLLLLIVPGAFLLLCYLVLMPVLLFEGAGPVAALRRSVQLIRGLWWQALTAVVMATLGFLMVGTLVFAAILAVIAALLAADPSAFAAVETAVIVGFGGLFMVCLSALLLVLHSAASSSA
jgi:hypothetical protein